MRVLTLIHLYPPHHLGGYEVACRGTMERFAEQGIEVAVLTADHMMAGVEERPTKVQVRRELRGWWDWDAWAPAQLGLAERIRRERHNQRALARAVQEFRPDVASVWNLGMTSWSLATLLESRRIPIVLTFLDHWVTFAYTFDAWTRIFDRRPWARPLGPALGLETRLPSFQGSHACTASRMIAESIAQNSRWKFPDAEIIPIGVDTTDFPISAPVEREWAWRILYVGRVVPQKGVHTLIRAFAHLPPSARLDIDGHAHDAQRRELLQLATDLGVVDRLDFSLSRSRQELRDHYRRADVLVFPSEWAEPFGIVPLEAMACGVPVVATGTGGSGEFLVDGVNCVRFAPGDAEALAEAVRQVAEDGGLRRRITEGGTASAGELTMDRFAKKLGRLHHRAATPIRT